MGKLLGINGLILATFFWGSTFILVKETISLVPIDGFLVVRFGFAAIIMFIFTLVVKRQIFIFTDLSVWGYGTLLGTLLYLSFLFQTEGLDRTSPAKAAFITGMNVILVPGFAYLLFRNKYRRYDVILTIIAFIGLGFVTLDINHKYLINFGDGLVIITAICIALHILYTERAKQLDLMVLLTVQLFVIAIEATIVAIIRDTLWFPNTTNQLIWLTLIVTILFATVYAFAVQIYAQQSGVPAVYIGIIFSLEPVFALLIDILVGDYPTQWQFLGMVLILLSTILYSVREDRSVDIIGLEIT